MCSFLPHVSEESRKVAEETRLRATDVVVITFPKTGTTWLQQTCEQLRTGGDMTFSEITERQPWLDFAWDCGQYLSLDQVASPRVFKSHQLLSAINPGAKYLSVIRDPEAVLMSWFAFQRAGSERLRPIFVDCVDANDYANTGHFEGNNIFGTNVWDFYVELWEARQEPNVLVLCYEALMADHSAHTSSIAGFLGIPADEALLQTVAAMSSKKFMRAHSTQFDDNFIVRKGQELGRAARVMEPASKVTPGIKNYLTPSTKSRLSALWSERVAPRTGLASYQDMAQALARSEQ